nr:MAG TPA: hypothetical protein [Caudoviricetes sp.]
MSAHISNQSHRRYYLLHNCIAMLYGQVFALSEYIRRWCYVVDLGLPNRQ